MDLKWLRSQLQRPGYTQVELAKRLTLAPSAISKILKGERKIVAHEADIIRDYVGSDPSRSAAPAASTVRRADPTEYESRSNFAEWPRTVPLYGTVSGGSGGLSMGNGRELDWVRRPPRFLERRGKDKDIFAVLVEETSMVPAFEPGALVYVDPLPQPNLWDYVIVEIQDSPNGEPRALIKRLVGRSGSKITLEQYNPPKTFDVPQKHVVRLYRVLPTKDLLGV